MNISEKKRKKVQISPLQGITDFDAHYSNYSPEKLLIHCMQILPEVGRVGTTLLEPQCTGNKAKVLSWDFHVLHNLAPTPPSHRGAFWLLATLILPFPKRALHYPIQGPLC